jgi:translation initiation factor 5A
MCEKRKPPTTTNGGSLPSKTYALALIDTRVLPQVFTGKKYDDTINCTAGFHGIDVPLTTYAHFSLMDVDKSDGTLSLLTADGEPKEDAMLSRGEDGLGWDAVGEELVKRFDEGESLKVKVLTIMGKDLVVEVNTDTDA